MRSACDPPRCLYALATAHSLSHADDRLTAIGHAGDVVVAGITTAVVMVAAALSPHAAWQQPRLRAGDTTVGIAIGLAASWLT
jgi:hypothetical protein